MALVRTGNRVFSTESGRLGRVLYADQYVAQVKWDDGYPNTPEDIDTLKSTPSWLAKILKWADAA